MAYCLSKKTIEFIKKFKNENPHLFTHDSTWINIMNNSEDLVPSQSNKNACKTYDIIIKKKSMTTLQMVLETSDNITKVGEFLLHAIINEIHNNEYMIIENSNDKYMDMIRCILSKKINIHATNINGEDVMIKCLSSPCMKKLIPLFINNGYDINKINLYDICSMEKYVYDIEKLYILNILLQYNINIPADLIGKLNGYCEILFARMNIAPSEDDIVKNQIKCSTNIYDHKKYVTKCISRLIKELQKNNNNKSAIIKKINENIKKSKENIIKKSEENTNEKYIQDSYEYFLHDHQHESQDYKSNIHYI